MGKKPLTLTIVIPVYNEEFYIKNCLDAIAAQSLLPDQVIVVDNNSIDNSIPITRTYKFVEVTQERRQGLVYARNAGFDLASSDIIARIDADTVLPTDWVQLVMEEFKKNPNQAVTGGGEFYDMPLKRIIKHTHSLLYFRLNKIITGQYMLWGPNMAFPRVYWSKVKPLIRESELVAEDMDMALVLQKYCPIVYRTNLVSNNSLRSAKNGVSYSWRYLKRWPESFRRHSHRSYIAAWIVIIMLIVISAPLSFVTQDRDRT